MTDELAKSGKVQKVTATHMLKIHQVDKESLLVSCQRVLGLRPENRTESDGKMVESAWYSSLSTDLDSQMFEPRSAWSAHSVV